MTITFAITEITGINPVPGDSGAGDFPAVNDTDNFSFLVTFTDTELDVDLITPIIVPITGITATCSFSNINITIVGTDAFRVSGTYSGIFNDAYVFRMKDLSIQTLLDYNSSAVGLFKWIIPSVRVAVSDFNVAITTASGTTNEMLTQYVYWNLDPHFTLFQQIIAKGM